MKKLIIGLLVLFTVSCAEKEVDISQLVERNGIIHEINNDNPYTGKAISKFQNQQVEQSGYYSNGLKEKTWMSFQENGLQLKVEHYSKGKLHGTSEEYDNQGKLMLSKEFTKDTLNGKYIKYDSIGRQSIEGAYAHGLKNGIWVERLWDDSTKKMTYKSDVLDGEFSETNKEGIVTLQGNYTNGIKHGAFIHRNVKGDIYKKQEFNNGNIVQYKEWNTSGNLVAEREFPGLSQWYSNGKKIAEAYYSNMNTLNENSVKIWQENKAVDVYSTLSGSIWKSNYINSNNGRYKEYFQYVFNSNGSYNKGYYFLITPVDNGYSARMQPQGRGKWKISKNLPHLLIDIHKGRNQYPSESLLISKLSKNEMVIDDKILTRVLD